MTAGVSVTARVTMTARVSLTARVTCINHFNNSWLNCKSYKEKIFVSHQLCSFLFEFLLLFSALVHNIVPISFFDSYHMRLCNRHQNIRWNILDVRRNNRNFHRNNHRNDRHHILPLHYLLWSLLQQLELESVTMDLILFFKWLHAFEETQ